MTYKKQNQLENSAITNINNGYFRDAISDLLKLDKLDDSQIQDVQNYINNVPD